MSRSEIGIEAPESSGVMLDPRVQWNKLYRDWRRMFRIRTLGNDVLAAIAVALVALPLSLAIANASGVKPEVGLITAVIGGVVVSLFGGCSLQVSGPAAAMTFLVYEGVTKFGVGGVIVATLMAGALQLVAGVFRLGRIMQYIPRPVVSGFLAGIGITIFCTQLPVILGYDVPHDEEGGALALLWSTAMRFGQTQPSSLVVGGTAFLLMLVIPKISRRIPAPLIAVVAATVLPWALKWDGVALLGTLPAQFPMPSLPSMPWHLWNEVVEFALTIAVLASLESLLSASVVDSLSDRSPLDNDQELVGQGLGNLTSAVFGGLPVTGVIARSATNIQSGARTRLSAILHALMILAMMLLMAEPVGWIPKAALAGVLCAVATRMIEWHAFRSIWSLSRLEGVVYLVTAGAIVSTDLVGGVQFGMLAAFLYVVYELSRLHVQPVGLDGAIEEGISECPNVQVHRIEGPLFFASGFHLRNVVNRMGGTRTLILDMTRVPLLDYTGLEHLEDFIHRLKERGTNVILSEPTRPVLERIRSVSHESIPDLSACPIYFSLQDALLHAGSQVGPEPPLCRICRPLRQCQELMKALGGVGALNRTPVPNVRAVVAANDGTWNVEDTRDEQGRAVPLETLPEGTVRPNPETSWNPSIARPTIHPTAFIDPRATVIGRVEVGEKVYVGPGVSVRADEGTPFFIGDHTNLQDGVTIHALRGKVILAGGRGYAVYVGRNVCCTHQSLIHGPCHIGDNCFIGFQAIVHDSVLGEGCVLGLGAVVVGVTLPPNRWVPHNAVVDTQDKADALSEVDDKWRRLRSEVVEVNQELAHGHLVASRAGHPSSDGGAP